MRWVLIFLLAANVGYFTWRYFQGDAVDEAALAAPAQPASARKAGEPLHLLSELSPAVVARPGKHGAADTQVQIEPLCWLLGPLPEIVTARQLLLRFEKEGVAARLEDIERIIGLDYLLYIGPFAGKQEGLKRLRQLHNEKIDSFLITKGPISNAISLGLFSSAKKAETAQASFIEQGFEPKIRENERTGTQKWLIVPLEHSETLPPAFWDELAQDFGGVERKQNWCSAIASVSGID